MESTTLQQRIEKRAADRLMNDLLKASNRLHEIGGMIGHDFKPILSVGSRYNQFEHKTEIWLQNTASQEIFNKALPHYISNITDEILKKVDDIDWLLSEKNTVQEDY